MPISLNLSVVISVCAGILPPFFPYPLFLLQGFFTNEVRSYNNGRVVQLASTFHRLFDSFRLGYGDTGPVNVENPSFWAWSRGRPFVKMPRTPQIPWLLSPFSLTDPVMGVIII
jgi:hypothetical protein